MRSNNTGGWFLESEAFKLWCERQSLLRLHGKCGSGKTILSSTIIQAIIERCSLKGQTAIAYFFFDFSDNKKQNLDNMLRSIACQLLKQFQGDISPIDHIYDGRRRHFEIVLEILRFLLQAFDKAYIILDALDECSDRHEMGKILKAIQSWECPPPNMLITSRKFPDIEKMLNSVAWPQETVNIETTVVDADIFTYVDETLKTDPRFKRWRDNAEIQKEITETLLEKSNGMYASQPLFILVAPKLKLS